MENWQALHHRSDQQARSDELVMLLQDSSLSKDKRNVQALRKSYKKGTRGSRHE
jgi:hypothetical protein